MSIARAMFQGRVQGVMTVSEAMAQGTWFKGKLVRDPSISVEIGFEAGCSRNLPGTSISYLGAWRSGSKKAVFEFQEGSLIAFPSEQEYQLLFRPLIERLMRYRPMRVID